MSQSIWEEVGRSSVRAVTKELTAMNSMIRIVSSFAVASLAIAACSSSEGGASSASATASAPARSAAPAKSAAPAAATTPATPPEPPKEELTDKDLSKAGAAFKGWTAKGPADADVIEDLGGARIVPKKVTGFDLGFKMAKEDLKELKKNLEKGAEGSKVKLTFMTDTADALEWTTEVGTVKTWDFHIHQRSSGKDVTCYTPTPRDTEANASAEKAACQSLAKK